MNDARVKDRQYFLDGNTYNCPYCKRKSVGFKVKKHGEFDFSIQNKFYYYLIECNEKNCKKVSLHYSKFELSVINHEFKFPLETFVSNWKPGMEVSETKVTNQQITDSENNLIQMDDAFIYHLPSSFFTLNERIPNELRKDLDEAENSLNYNLLTGSSASIRKTIYKLLKIAKVPEKNENNEKIRFKERIDKLKEIYPQVNTDYFDDLKRVGGLTSLELHEDDWRDISRGNIKFLIELVKFILDKIFTNDNYDLLRDKLTKLKSEADKEKKK